MALLETQEPICQAIPHRPPFLFIDELVELTETGAKARRAVRAEEPYFEGHYPGNPIMPGVLLCEAVFQTAAVYLAKQVEGDAAVQKTPVLSRILEAKFKNMVKPGDVVDIEVSMKETVSKFHFMKGTIKKEGKLVLTIEFALALVEAEA